MHCDTQNSRAMNLKTFITLLLSIKSMQALSDDAYTSYRLPTSLTPSNYKLEVTTHLGDGEGFKFDGKVWITVSFVRF